MNKIFEGIGTAVITPFLKGEIDYTSLGKILDFQLEGGINAIIACGTTGEAPALTLEEQERVILFVTEYVSGRVPIIAGVGSNNFEKAVHLSRFARNAGADGVLAVTPYYNKGTADGILKYYEGIHSAFGDGVIAYNVPTRTGFDISVELYCRLAKEGFIQGIKEAKSDIAKAAKLRCNLRDISVYSGNDDLLLPFLALGCEGCISVASNIIPFQMAEICRSFKRGEAEESRELFLKYLPLMEGLFSAVNPVPVKYAAKLLGLCSGEIRLPLTEYSGDEIERLLKELNI